MGYCETSLGGTRLNVGCIPSKVSLSLLQNSKRSNVCCYRVVIACVGYCESSLGAICLNVGCIPSKVSAAIV